MDIFEAILNFIFRFIIWPVWLIISFVLKFFKDVVNHLYGKVVVIVATGILIYLISYFLN